MIDHKFPESGHSYMDSDRDFGNVERKVRGVSNVYDVNQYHSLMAQSLQKSKPQITRMQGRLYDIKALPTALQLTHRKKTTDGGQVRFRDKVKWVRVTECGSYMFRQSFDKSEPWKTVDLMTDPATASTQTPCISEACKFIRVGRFLPDGGKNGFFSAEKYRTGKNRVSSAGTSAVARLSDALLSVTV